MDETLYCGIDLHGNNGMYVITDQEDRPQFKKRLPNVLSVVLRALEPFRQRLAVVAVESTYNWYWLVDGLQAQGYPVVPANPAKIDQVEAVHHAIRRCPAAKRFYDRKLARHNGALATKALASKWSKAAYYMIKRQESFDLTRMFG